VADNGGDLDALKQQLQRADDYKHIFNTAEGQRVLRDVLDFCGLLSDGFAEDPYVTAYNAGRRSVGVYLLEKLEMDRQRLMQMVREMEEGNSA